MRDDFWETLLKLSVALGVAILAIYAIEEIFLKVKPGDPPMLLVARLEVIAFLLICFPHVLHHVDLIFRALTDKNDHPPDTPGFRLVGSILAGLAGSVAVLLLTFSMLSQAQQPPTKGSLSPAAKDVASAVWIPGIGRVDSNRS